MWLIIDWWWPKRVLHLESHTIRVGCAQESSRVVNSTKSTFDFNSWDEYRVWELTDRATYISCIDLLLKSISFLNYFDILKTYSPDLWPSKTRFCKPCWISTSADFGSAGRAEPYVFRQRRVGRRIWCFDYLASERNDGELFIVWPEHLMRMRNSSCIFRLPCNNWCLRCMCRENEFRQLMA